MDIIKTIKKDIHLFFFFLIDNIHTILFLAGLALISIAMFMLGTVIGLVITGIFLILISLIITQATKIRR